MLFQAASRALLALLAANFLSTSSRAATLERLSAVVPRNVSVSYDQIYDDGETPANAVSCSTWMTAKDRDYPTFSYIPAFPLIGGADFIDGSNSALCGQCWQLTYYTPTETNIHVVAIDTATRGFTISERAMNALTDGEARKLGRVDAVGYPVAKSHCGMP
ncbi:hypothetical protein GSI_04460 [Ganoderma sinense ZZ0214-1]|uniref:Cerato-platanin n=1 Tax=Ganoderma sinense ZZ0214-1 TaxID=1077348 RepID=A0A2G8SGY6_9APHY|nr:hypothetical protein GSI_04460 [Ganoderma sinense ZZ0214-1]